jgi:hypothetical protein
MRNGFMKQATVVGACTGYAAYCLFVGLAGIRTSPDSVFYLSFSPIVPTGYSVFLRLLGAEGAVVVQPLVFAASLAWLGLEIVRQWSSLALALAVIAGAVAVPELAALHSSVLTESLFMSCELMLLASMARFLRQPTSASAALAAVVAGLAATIRNAGYVFLPVLLVMTLVNWRRLGSPKARIVGAIALPMIALIAGERAIAYAVNGNRTTSLLGRHMFAKAALIEAPRAQEPLDPARSAIEDHLQGDFAPIRQVIATAPASIRSLLTVYYETCLEGPCTREMREATLGSLPETEQNSALARIAFGRIARAPGEFARLTIRHYVSLWTAYKQAHPDTTPLLNEFLSSRHPLPYESQAFSWREPGRVLQFQADPRVRFFQPAVAVIAWITGGLAALALTCGAIKRSPSALLTMAALSSLAAHAGILFSATFAPGISRFAVSFWPAVMTGLVCGFWTLDVLKGRNSASQSEAELR